MLVRGGGLPQPLEAVHHSVRESNGGSTMTCDPGRITCNNGMSLPKSEIVQPSSSTSSVAIRHALGADRLRREIGPESAREFREGVGQHVEYGQRAKKLGESGTMAEADTDQHFEGDQDDDEDGGYESVDHNEQLRGQLEVVETHVRTVIRSQFGE